MTFLAKTNGTTLKDHSNAVALRCKEIASKLLTGYELQTKFGATSAYSTDDVINACYFAGLMHDVGKAIPFFQDYLKKMTEPTSETDLVDYIGDVDDGMRYHNEFSWSFICVYEDELRQLFSIASRTCWEAIKYAIFWHHAAAPDIEEIRGRDIFYSDKFDVESIKGYVEDATSITLPVKEITDRGIPEYFAVNPLKYEDNSLIMFVRSVLIRADREVSGYTKPNDEELETIAQVDCPASFNPSRYEKQMEIVNLANQPTNVVSAPAGFGKTIVGLSWAVRFSKTVYWVCPRNAVIDSVYRSLVDLKDVLNLDIFVEKMYTGEIQDKSESVGRNRPHIIVTNIDAITTPLANNRQANLQYIMMVNPMVFDEFHEFSMDNSPMFAAYNLLMSVRNDFTRASSLLVSATPITLYNESSFRIPVNYLPSKNGHYEPQHAVTYSVKMATHFDDTIGNNTAFVYNVVKDAQEAVTTSPNALCFHSRFTAEDKLAKLDRLYAMYGKHCTEEKVGVASGPIIRASMDISFRMLSLMVSSPNSDMQTIGRCNRWGEYDDAEITFIVPEKLTQSNRVYLDHHDFPSSHMIYSKWVECLKANMKPRMTLHDMYAMLDDFNKANIDLLARYQDDLHTKGIELLVKKSFPHRPAYTAKSIKNRGNKSSLRNPDPSISFVVQNAEGTYVGPFQVGESYADFTNHYVKDAFRPYYKKDRTELLHHVDSDPTFAEHFPKLYKHLHSKNGKAAKRMIEFYGTTTAMWRNPDYPFVVRPQDMRYDSAIGLIELDDVE